jgi:hypothetical protein
MKDDPNPTSPPKAPANPAEDVLSGGVRGEVLGCPTGLADTPPGPVGGPAAAPADPTEGHGPPHLEKLEGRDEAGRDAQDEAEEDVARD